MRTLGMIALLGLAACARPGPEHESGHASPRSVESNLSASVVPGDGPGTSIGGPFAGAWASCQGASSPDECNRYVLAQRGDRICGTWSYVASGQAYEGRLVARATSSTEARRTHVCGRPGSETSLECLDGWQRIDKPLRLCDGKLEDLPGADRSCFAEYAAFPTSQAEREGFRAQPWIRDCLSNGP